MDEPRTLSVSQINAYLACPLKYRFQYIDQIPRPWRAAALAFGSSIHAAVEWYWTRRQFGNSPDVTEVLKIFDADWYAQNMEPLVFSERESKDGLLQKGHEMLQLYVTEQGRWRSESGRAERPIPAAVEQSFEVDLYDPETGEVLDVRFRGFIDLIEQDGTVVDLKTAGRSLESGGLERHLQLSAYALAGLILTGQIPKLRLDMLFKTARPRFERLESSRTTAELSWTAQLIREVALAIQTEHFFPNPSWRCSECEYFAHCQRWRGYEVPRADLVAIEESGEGVGDAVA